MEDEGLRVSWESRISLMVNVNGVGETEIMSGLRGRPRFCYSVFSII